MKGIFNLTAFVNFFYQLFIGNFQLMGPLLNKLLKVLLVFFELGDIFKDDCKSLTSLIKNQGNQFDFKKISLSIDLNAIYLDLFSPPCRILIRDRLLSDK